MEQLQRELHGLRFEVAALRAQAAVTRSEFSRAIDHLGTVQADLLSSDAARGLLSRQPLASCRSLAELSHILQQRRAAAAAGSMTDSELVQLVWRYAELATSDVKHASWQAPSSGNAQQQQQQQQQEGGSRQVKRLVFAVLRHATKRGLSAPAAASVLSALAVVRWSPGKVVKAAAKAAVAGPGPGPGAAASSSATPSSSLGPSSMAELAAALYKHRFYSPEAMEQAAQRLLPCVGVGPDSGLDWPHLAQALAAFAGFCHRCPALSRAAVQALQDGRMAELGIPDAALTLWALAVLEDLPEALFLQGFNHVRGVAATVDNLDVKNQRKLYQAFLVVCANMEEDGRSAAALRREVLGSRFGQRLREAWTAPDPYRINTSKGDLFEDVREALEALEVPFEAGVQSGDLEIDFLLHSPTSSGAPVALQIVGPNQITSTRPRRVMGQVEASRRLLEVQGFDPVQLPFFEVQSQPHGLTKDYLHRKLARSLGWPVDDEDWERRGAEPEKNDRSCEADFHAARRAKAEVVLVGPDPDKEQAATERKAGRTGKSTSGASGQDAAAGEQTQDGGPCPGVEAEEHDFDSLLQGLRAATDGKQVAKQVFQGREWRVKELRKLLQHLGMPSTGKKADLVDRVMLCVFDAAPQGTDEMRTEE